MYENTYMYAIERSPEYLAHYGVRGMKWGVRRAIKSGNAQRLSRQYAKAQKKLAKLEKQAGRSKRYARRAALMGVGAAAAGGLAAAGTTGVGRAIRKSGSVVSGGSRVLGKGLTAGGKALGNLANAIPGRQTGMSKLAGRMNAAGRGMTANAGMAGQGLRRAGTQLASWGGKHSIAKSVGQSAENAIVRSGIKAGRIAPATARGMKVNKAISGVSNNTIARIGAGAVGAGLAVGAARNAYKAATAQKKAAKFRSEMNTAFKGTKYANGGNGGNRQGKKRRRK